MYHQPLNPFSATRITDKAKVTAQRIYKFTKSDQTNATSAKNERRLKKNIP